MDFLEMAIWLVYPYLVIAILGMGLIWQINVPLTAVNHDYKKSLFMQKFFNRFLMILLILSIITGIGVIIFYNVTDDPLLIFHWVMSLISLNPQLEIIESISTLSRTHLFFLSTFLCMVAFSSKLRKIFKPLRFFKKRK